MAAHYSIAVRVLRTAKRLHIPTVAIYTRTDATSPHVLLADEAVALRPDDPDPVSNSRGYLDAEAIVEICKERSVTLVHPGYGFLSENTHFASLLQDAGMTFLGPRPETIQAMGLKHEAKALAIEVNVPLVPGSDGLLETEDEAVEVAYKIGYPVMLKSTAGGGGMGLAICRTADELRMRFHSTQERATSLFKHGGVFLERYYPHARHIEIQVFGNGLGHAIHLGERECSVQRRHQKVIEETPSPFMTRHPDVFERMSAAALRLCQRIKYASAGTVEFLVDDDSQEFFFLEMNTRLQVEHPITEATNFGLDIVELMIRQGIAERETRDGGLFPDKLDQDRFLYCENPAAQFKPSPGVLQHVELVQAEWLRVESWVETGTTITPYFDPLVCKLVVTAPTREEAIARMVQALSESKVHGPPNNMAYLKAICESDVFKAGNAVTTFLDTFAFTPQAVDVLSGGLETSVQDYPGRRIGMGIPRGGPMDPLAFRAANMLVKNDPGTEALEITLVGCRLLFHVAAVIAVTDVGMWRSVVVPAGAKVAVGTVKDTGFRAYLAVRGGFPEIPEYLGSKSTSSGLGGYQGRALHAGDTIALGACSPLQDERTVEVPPTLIPVYPVDWVVYCLAGPHSDEEFVTTEGIQEFFDTRWKWARETGGEGGSHPSNVLDNGYAFGTINVNGDTPVILTNDGPDMGGYMCFCTVATEELWKIGQLRPGSTIQFRRISAQQATELAVVRKRYFAEIESVVSSKDTTLDVPPPAMFALTFTDLSQDPKIHVIEPAAGSVRPRVVIRQAGDSAILVEYGDMKEIRQREVNGVWSLAPCIRSTMVRYDPSTISQADLLVVLIEAESSLPDTLEDMVFPARRITFPIVLNDRWSREALERYMRTTRAEAAYLPSNIEYLARNNGLDGGAEEALRLLIKSEYLVFAVGFYMACPFLVPIDPRCRLVGQKMNPSRTYTPRGSVGIAGLVAAIYPIESPGGYQLYGRTLPPWQTWGKGRNFGPDQPWLLQPFDQLVFEPVAEEQYVEAETQFDAGRYVFKIEERNFSMGEYNEFVSGIANDVKIFKEKQAQGVKIEETRERGLFSKWLVQKQQEAPKETEMGDDTVGVHGAATVVSSLTASIWKIKCKPGDVVKSGEDVLIILEAMKTEVNVEAGEENIGRTVAGFGKGVKEGTAVGSGDVLVVFK
ncbi:urea carboxylase [Fomitopsis serialis]|uniref:urea carboxylase n=1 Tax=Fomitopsis serialis TaxID=139415 RepID=UPI002007D1EB|nr:urea carboxylase [Neoantrodia serialis]KAH9927658.1 urea carboxylase [Neoantrodia serialis]